MNKAVFLGLATAALLVSGSAMAGGTDQQSSSPQATNQQSDNAPDPNQVICKQQAAPIGTLIPAAPVCKTRQQWTQMRQDAQQYLEREQNLSHQGVLGKGG